MKRPKYSVYYKDVSFADGKDVSIGPQIGVI